MLQLFQLADIVNLLLNPLDPVSEYSRHCHNNRQLLLHGCYMAVTWLLHWCYMAVTWLLHWCYMVATWLLHGCYMEVILFLCVC